MIPSSWKSATSPAPELVLSRSPLTSGREGPVLSSRFPMPFWRGFRLEVTGITGRATVRVGPTQYPQGRSGYFRAVCSDADAGPGEDFVYVDRPGAGKLVGTVLTVRPGNAPVEKGWWEGDVRSYADGRRTPGVHGTGHEDDHLGGWSNEFLFGPFTLPMNGAPRVDLLDLNRPYNGDATMYRHGPRSRLGRTKRRCSRVLSLVPSVSSCSMPCSSVGVGSALWLRRRRAGPRR